MTLQSGSGEFRVNTTTEGDQFHPAMTALWDGGFLVAWATTQDILIQRFDSEGAFIGNTLEGDSRRAGGRCGRGCGSGRSDPVVGAGVGLLVGLKAIWDGSQLGGAAGWIGSGAGMAYPSPLVLRIGLAGPWAESRPVPIPGPYGPKGR